MTDDRRDDEIRPDPDVDEIAELLAEAGAHPPHTRPDVGSILKRAAQRTFRRWFTGCVTATAAVVLAVGFIVTVLPTQEAADVAISATATSTGGEGTSSAVVSQAEAEAVADDGAGPAAADGSPVAPVPLARPGDRSTQAFTDRPVLRPTSDWKVAMPQVGSRPLGGWLFRH